MGLPKRRGTIASAAQTPWTRHWGELGWGLVLGWVPEWVLVQGLEMGLTDRRAGPVVGWGWSACAARCFGRRDHARLGTKTCPSQPPHGADHPHPTPPARDAADPGHPLAWTFAPLGQHQSSPARQKLPLAGGRHRLGEEVAPAVSASLERPEAQAKFQRRPGVPAQLETNESGHASQHKPSNPGMSPPTRPNPTFPERKPRPPGSLSIPCPIPTH